VLGPVRYYVQTKTLLSAILLVAACSKAKTMPAPEPEPTKMKSATTASETPMRRVVGTDPGCVLVVPALTTVVVVGDWA